MNEAISHASILRANQPHQPLLKQTSRHYHYQPSLVSNHKPQQRSESVKRQTTLAFLDGLLFGMKWDNTAQRMMVEIAGERPAKEID
jgi:hypothetical protein